MSAEVGPFLYVFVLVIIAGSLFLRLRSRSRDARDRPVTSISNADIESAIRSHNLLQAIKLYRLRSGCGLAEAKAAVEAIAANLEPHS